MIGRRLRAALPVLSWIWAASWGAGSLGAQDSVPPIDRGVRIGITYTPGVRPGMLVLGGPRVELLDSVRAILARDLDYGDRFELINLPGGDSLTIGISSPEGDPGGHSAAGAALVNYPLYAALGADYAVNAVLEGDSGVTLTVYDVRGEGVRREMTIDLPRIDTREYRMRVHRAADEIVRVAAGAPGFAATSLLLVRNRRIYVVDSDGWGIQIVSPDGVEALSPDWSPDGKRFAYMDFGEGATYVQDLVGGGRARVSAALGGQEFTPVFSPDGRTVSFSRTTGDGTDIYEYNLAERCCLQRLTVGRFSDNLSPTYSPDGRRIAFVSTRAGLPQVYVMGADGTDQELFAPFDYGITGQSNAPEWSPDGLTLAFHRVVEASPQVFVMDVASRSVRQLTSAGRNEDPTWAPDGRHLAFVSNRTGSRQIWVMDLDTGRIRQLTRIGEARLPRWSSRLPEATHNSLPEAE